MRVYVLLFNVGTDNEGIHTIKLKDPDQEIDATHDVVLAFEQEEDAARFALLLEAQDFPQATVESIDREEIEDFCDTAGLTLQFVSEGMLAVPPEVNLEQTDWRGDGSHQSDLEDEPSEFPSDLDEIKRRLERLL
jgi:hypothetical protein